MPIYPCPSCGKALSITDALVGKQVRCSNCLTVFVAGPAADAPRTEAPSPPESAPERADDRPPRPRDEGDRDRPRRRYRYEDDDYDDDLERRPRRDALPHRGNTVLTLGIVALVSMSFCGPLLMLPLGIVAWVMGSADLRQMSEGSMDPSGASVTRAGKICGMIAAILSIVCCVGYTLYIGAVIAAGGFK